MEGQGGSSKDGATPDGGMPAFLFRPTGHDKKPAVILLMLVARPPKEAHAPFLADGEVVILEISHVS